MILFVFVVYCYFLIFLADSAFHFSMTIGQSSLGIVNLLNLDLDVLYQLIFLKKECEHLHAAFSCRDTSLPSSKRSQLTITNFKKQLYRLD